MMRKRAFLLCCVIISTVAADQADVFFNDTQVQEIRLTFANPDWYQVLYDSHDKDPDDPYFAATFAYGDQVLTPVGVRFKGNSSFRVKSQKKSIKIDFDTFQEGQTFLGLKKLNFNNAFKDPSFLREKLFLDFAARFVPAIRAVHTRVYINDVYWGLYTAVEQIDKTFIQSRFGSGEDGNLYKAETSSDAGPQSGFGSDLSWLGDDPNAYAVRYQLKTNEDDNDYSQLMTFIDILNNTPIEEMPVLLEPIFDVETALSALALNNLFVNLDSYCGSAHNYYLYDCDRTGKIVHLHWDTNESFGRFLAFTSVGEDPLEMHPFWMPVSQHRAGPGVPTDGVQESRPLMERLWAVESYEKMYVRALAGMLRAGFDTDSMSQRIHALAELIRSSVYSDPHKMYSNAAFEKNLTTYTNDAYGLLEFVTQRAAYFDTLLDTYAGAEDIHFNEILTVNEYTLSDEVGQFDAWVEILNLGPGQVDCSGLYLSTNPDDLLQWPLPDISLQDGQYLLLWLDGQSEQGADHAVLQTASSGGTLYLSDTTGNLIDRLTYPALDRDQSWGRTEDGTGDWDSMSTPTPGTANEWMYQAPRLFINELMADNEMTIEDPDEAGAYEDWIEIYNGEDIDVNMGGMVLTDDLNDTTGWTIPEGIVIPARGYVLFWADSDPEQGNQHTNFKLSRSGESVALHSTEAQGFVLIDSVTFAEQPSDQAYGRETDGGDQWTVLAYPTPGTTNSSL